MPSLRFTAGVAIGVAAMALCDPTQGRRRRAVLANRARAKARRARREGERRERYERGVEAGEEATARGAGEFHPTDDNIVADHLHQVLSALELPTRDITLEVVGGIVSVRGEVDTAGQIDAVTRAVLGEPGVEDVECYLHLPGEPAPNKEAARAASARAARSANMG